MKFRSNEIEIELDDYTFIDMTTHFQLLHSVAPFVHYSISKETFEQIVKLDPDRVITPHLFPMGDFRMYLRKFELVRSPFGTCFIDIGAMQVPITSDMCTEIERRQRESH